MKIIVIGDIHGRNTWKDVLNSEETWDKVIFLGDYWDSFDVPFDRQFYNFFDIMQFKKDNPETILLFGNHDLHYIIDSEYSGYQSVFAYQIREAILKFKDNFKVVHQEDKYLFSHAGVTQRFLSDLGVDKSNFVDTLNEYLVYKPKVFGFMYGGPRTDNYGDNIWQSPMWVRPHSLSINGLKSYLHIIGHTSVKQITIRSNYINCDALEHKRYLVIDDNKIFPRSL